MCHNVRSSIQWNRSLLMAGSLSRLSMVVTTQSVATFTPWPLKNKIAIGIIAFSVPDTHLVRRDSRYRDASVF